MSLATRCTSCGTIFRVVQDQLKVSEGWVRCGRCSEVFNALDGLFDLERDPPPPRVPAAAAAASLPVGASEFIASRSPPAADETDDLFPSTAAEPRDDERDAFVASRAPDEAATSPTAPAHPDWYGADPLAAFRDAPTSSRRGDHDDFVDARFPSEFPPEEETADDALQAPLVFEPPHDEGAPTIHAADELTPHFMREAERAERWQRPRVRRSLVAGVLLLAIGLALQLGLHWRDTIAVQWPQSVPALQALCGALDCRIEPLQRIQAVVVDGSALNRLADGSGYRLELLLRNRDSVPVALPAIELQLNDGSGATLSRRVFQPTELGITAAVIEPGKELPLQLSFDAGGARVAGYSVELFHP